MLSLHVRFYKTFYYFKQFKIVLSLSTIRSMFVQIENQSSDCLTLTTVMFMTCDRKKIDASSCASGHRWSLMVDLHKVYLFLEFLWFKFCPLTFASPVSLSRKSFNIWNSQNVRNHNHIIVLNFLKAFQSFCFYGCLSRKAAKYKI